MRMRFERVADVTEIKGIEKDAIKKIPMGQEDIERYERAKKIFESLFEEVCKINQYDGVGIKLTPTYHQIFL